MKNQCPLKIKPVSDLVPDPEVESQHSTGESGHEGDKGDSDSQTILYPNLSIFPDIR